MSLKIPTGIADYRLLREGGYEYVDKTHLITELIDRSNYTVVLLPRPRRFGKTINLTMLRWFFEKRDEDLWHLFEDLHVARAGENYRAHFQKYPVISISFKGCKASTWESSFSKLREVLQQMCKTHHSVLDGKLDAWDTNQLQALVDGLADRATCELSLKLLTRWLHEVHGTRPIVLIDEYDTAIHAGYSNGFYAEVIGFFRSFLEAGLKDNVHVERAVLTGILRVAWESTFSGLNNLGVYSLLRSEFNTCFGFTEPEVSRLLENAGRSELMENVRAYYNGYEFGGISIYNPWSILEFLASADLQLIPYWLNTSQNELIKELLQHHAFAVEREVRGLLEGGSIERRLDDAIVFPELKQSTEALWNILVFSGYLKAAPAEPLRIGQPPPPYRLSIPNREVAEVYRTTFRSWMDSALMPRGGSVLALTRSLLEGDAEEFADQLGKFVAFLPSYHDVRGAKPEQFYQGLVIGLLAALEPEYSVVSNRESGEGRPDVLITPRRAGKPGAVLELKTARKGQRTIKQAMAEGLRQLQQNDYAAELRNAGVETIQQWVVAFDGKKLLVESPAKPVTKTPARRTKKAAKKRR